MDSEKFTAIVPVAGTGTRLRPHTHTWPKVLLTVGDKPIIGHILDELKAARISRICMVIGYLGDKIKEYVSRDYPELDVDYALQENPRGLGHAIWTAREKAKGPVLILLGDTIISADLNEFVNSEHDCLAVKEVEDPRRFGVATVRGGFVEKLVEKPENPPSNLAIVGIYSFRDSGVLFGALGELEKSGKTTKGEMQLTDALEIMVRSGRKIKPVKIEGWHDCGKKETILETNRHILKKKNLSAAREGNLLVPPVYVSPTAKIKNSIIGPHVSVGDNAEISDSIVTDSIVNRGAVIENMNMDQSLVGPSAVLKGRVEHLNIGENSEIKFE